MTAITGRLWYWHPRCSVVDVLSAELQRHMEAVRVEFPYSSHNTIIHPDREKVVAFARAWLNKEVEKVKEDLEVRRQQLERLK